MQLGTNDSLPKNLLLILLLPVPISRHTCMLLYATKDTYSFTEKYCVTEVQNRSQEISLYIAVTLLHIFRVLKHNERLAVFPHALLSQLATSHTDDHELFELIKVMVVTVNHWHCLEL